jgi:hypothetical protein
MKEARLTTRGERDETARKIKSRVKEFNEKAEKKVMARKDRIDSFGRRLKEYI